MFLFISTHISQTEIKKHVFRMSAIITQVGRYQKVEETWGVLIKYANANRA